MSHAEPGQPEVVRGAAESFRWRGGEIFCEDVPLAALAARHGTPLYVYSQAAIEARFALLRSAFGPGARICYAVKSNSNLALLALLGRLGAGFDLVSGGELRRVQAAGLAPAACVFAGVAKDEWEIDAALAAGIGFFNLESAHEIPLLDAAGDRLGKDVEVAIRINPDVDAGTHAYISTGKRENKFGLSFPAAHAAIAAIRASRRVRLVGYHVHLGSQLRVIDPYLAAFAKVAEFMAESPAHRDGVRHYDLGGGFGISYGDGKPGLDVRALAAALLPRLRALGLDPVLEPGRFLVAEAGALVVRVLGDKHSGTREFVLVDGAMNDLLRPALYQAVHPIVPVRPRPGPSAPVDVVGPVCESGDFLGKDVPLPRPQRGDLLAVLAAGAYGATMASNYNTRRRPAEVLVSGQNARLVRRRERFEELWAQELDPEGNS